MLKICFATGDIAPRPETSYAAALADAGGPETIALHPGYFFADAADDERLGLNAVLQRLGAAMDGETHPDPDLPLAVEALAPIASRTLMCFISTESSRVKPPALASDDLLPLDRETMAHHLVQALPFSLPPAESSLPAPAARLAAALAALPAPAAALHWLLLHRLLPALCGPNMLAALREARAPLFSGLPEGPVLPLEFALALLLATPEHRPAAERLALSYWLNVPTAQGVLTALRQADSNLSGQLSLLPRLERSDLNRGEAGAVLVEHELHKRTPLWFYLWREKALLGTEGRLGPLGARLLAEGMMGLVALAGTLPDAFAPEAESPAPAGTLEAWEAVAA